jgi:hypothetical protein
MKWERKHISWGIFLSVDPINVLNILVVNIDDPQVKSLHA